MASCNDKQGADKRKHFWAEFAIGVLVAVLVGHFAPAFVGIMFGITKATTQSLVAFPITWLIALCAGMLVGIGKELRDKAQSGNHFCVWDLLADFWGAVIGSLIGSFSVFANLTY